MRFVPVPRKLLRKGCYLRSVPVNDKSESSGRTDKLLQRLANFSQLGLLVLGMFGYFYTIVPVFQNQQLQEQAAKLEIEKATAEKQLTSLLAQQARVKDDIRVLQDKWEKEKAHSDQLANDMAHLKVSEIGARSQAAKAEVKLQQELRTLDAARWKLVLLDLLFAYRLLPSVSGDRTDFSAGMDKKPRDFILEKEADWSSQYENLLSAIGAISRKNDKRHEYPDSYYAELRAFVVSKKLALQCEKPSFNALHDEYTAKIAALEPVIDTELDRYIVGIRNNYTAKGQRVEITEDFLSGQRRDIKAGKVFIIENLYRNKLTVLRQGCEKKFDDVFKEIEGIKEGT